MRKGNKLQMKLTYDMEFGNFDTTSKKLFVFDCKVTIIQILFEQLRIFSSLLHNLFLRIGEKVLEKIQNYIIFGNQLKNKINLFLSGKLFPLPPSPPYQNLKVKKKSFHSNTEKSELAMQRSKQSKFIVVAFLFIHFLSFYYSEKIDCSITMFRKRAICKAVQN